MKEGSEPSLLVTITSRGKQHTKAASLAGTLDATAELVVANDINNDLPSSTFPNDSVFVRYTSNMTETIDENGEYSFFWDTPLTYDYIGLKLTLNNVTKWHVYWKRKIYYR